MDELEAQELKQLMDDEETVKGRLSQTRKLQKRSGHGFRFIVETGKYEQL